MHLYHALPLILAIGIDTDIDIGIDIDTDIEIGIDIDIDNDIVIDKIYACASAWYKWTVQVNGISAWGK